MFKQKIGNGCGLKILIGGGVAGDVLVSGKAESRMRKGMLDKGHNAQ